MPMSDVVHVTVPPGVSPGQTIHVTDGDGGRVVSVIVPQGMAAGSEFLVQFPADEAAATGAAAPPSAPPAEAPRRDPEGLVARSVMERMSA